MWREQYDRMLRGLSRVDRHYAGQTGYSQFGPEQVAEFRDDVIHAFQDVFHVRDWLRNDPTITIPSAHLGRLFTRDRTSFPNLHLIRDVANGSKHLVIKRPSVDPTAKVAAAAHVHWRPAARMEDGHISQSIAIEIGGGQMQDARDVLHRGHAELTAFLSTYGLP